ncbi:MAG: hypothetical protein HC881_00495 [Leptolyngbyaceae cyanobacterium SL_7_1]|nr:hypothetical protein [Leptolyngbyaceae cyanobacterium SL_7_1]
MKFDAQPLEPDPSSAIDSQGQFQGESVNAVSDTPPSFTLANPPSLTVDPWSEDGEAQAIPAKKSLQLPTWQTPQTVKSEGGSARSQAAALSTTPTQAARRQPRSPSFTLTAPLATAAPANPEAVRPLSLPTQTEPVPELPRFKLPHFGQHRHITNPEFALGLLKEMEGIVVGWQKELQQVLLKIQDLYLEGSVIDGWLESKPYEPQAHGASVLRHAEIDRLMDYVEEICNPTAIKFESIRPGYRLCGLDADGRPWSRPCPAERVPPSQSGDRPLPALAPIPRPSL